MNKVILMGRLTKEPELSYTQSNNTALCRFTLAVDRRFVSQGGERQADFIPIISWRKLAEFTSKYFSKGQKVVVVGNIQTRNWEDNDGKRHYATEVVADEAYFAESKRASGGYNETRSDNQTKDKTSPNNTEFELPDDFDDDGLPF